MDTESLHANSSDGIDDDLPSRPESSERIDVPSENDVLCGRGGSINSHTGNARFRDLVEKRKRVYLTARFKREKRLIASSIVSEIRSLDPPGRFLARKGNKDTGHWYDIGDEKARDKTSQALRENAPSIRAEIETEINQQRAEMKRKGAEEQGKAPAPHYPPSSHSYYPPQHAPPGHPGQQQQQQAYWEWYYRYYGYPPPPHGAPHPPPPHGAPHPPPPHAAVPPHPLMSAPYPPHPGLASPPPPPASHAQPPAAAPSPQAFWGAPPAPISMPQKNAEEIERENAAQAASQQLRDQHLAMELQQQENTAAYQARKERADENRAAARSNAFVALGSSPPLRADHVAQSRAQTQGFSAGTANVAGLTQEERDHRLAVALQEEEDNVIRSQLQNGGHSSRGTSRSSAAYKSLEQVVPASFVAWVTQDTGLKPKAVTRDRSVHFDVDGNESQSGSIQSSVMKRQSSVASTESRPLMPQTEPNGSLLSQVAHHILGSWEHAPAPAPAQVPPQAQMQEQMHQDQEMEGEGLEVQLQERRDETSLHPSDPGLQIDWPSRVGSCHSWLPETLGAAWSGANNTGGIQEHTGISVNSLEMDVSGNHDSVGGGSLCQLFEHDESLQRALREVPSWERSMRSKSPLPFHSGDGDDPSFVRVRYAKPAYRPTPTSALDTTSEDMDWD